MKVRLADVSSPVGSVRRPLFIDGSGREVFLAQGADPAEDADDDDEGDSGTGDAKDDDKTGDRKDKKDDDKDADSDALKKKLRLADKRAAEAEKKLREAEDKDKSELEVAKRDLEEAKKKNEDLAEDNRELSLVNAFLMVNTITWHDNEDALNAARRQGLLDDLQDKETGEVDKAKMKKALESLSKAKPHLVKKGAEEETPASTATHTVGGKGNKNGQQEGLDKATLSKRYSALRRL